MKPCVCAVDGARLVLPGRWLAAVARLMATADPLAVFECREQFDRDRPRTMLICQREFPAVRLDEQFDVGAPGASGDRLIVPILPGEHTLEVRALEQPPVFRNWQA